MKQAKEQKEASKLLIANSALVYFDQLSLHWIANICTHSLNYVTCGGVIRLSPFILRFAIFLLCYKLLLSPKFKWPIISVFANFCHFFNFQNVKVWTSNDCQSVKTPLRHPFERQSKRRWQKIYRSTTFETIIDERRQTIITRQTQKPRLTTIIIIGQMDPIM